MGNSTKSLQNIVDFCKTLGDLNASFPVGGFNNLLAIEVGNEVMQKFLSQRFNWKFNRIIIPPFYTISWQQDYATVNLATIGWLEHAVAVDINNTAVPKPIRPVECVRDLERTSWSYGMPSQVAWLPNDQLVQGTWPGPAQVYTNPLGAVNTPSNPPTNILDTNGNILILTTYGTTGGSAPAASQGAAAGTTVNDGSCVWTVANPKAQGLRIVPLPPQSGNVWQLYVIAQAKPTLFTSMTQMLDPIPDDFYTFFRDGFIAYMHRQSAAPVVRDKFPQMEQDWFASLARATGAGDREKDSAGIYPSSSIMAETGALPVGAAWPFGPFGGQ